MVGVFVDKWFSLGLAGEELPQKEIWHYLETFLVIPAGKMLLTSNRERLGMLSNLLHRTASTTKNYPAQIVYSTKVMW